ncbi:MAG: 2-hydroxy-6-oxo-2-4-heptadienoate hydrolase [Pyrinomonas sp.]|uniref:alpha/beta fold hydrolase n=1 Tax=Pyrinomonas sp. TaxID=2080306 RepID=UPI0033173310
MEIMRASRFAFLCLFVCGCFSSGLAAPTPQALQINAPSKQVAVYGAKLRYFDVGNGPVIILLHGLGGDANGWSATLPALASKYRVIALDQIGFGQSDKPFLQYRVATYVDFLDGFMRALKIERAALVGNSLGGWIAAAYALAHPQKVTKLVLVDAAGFAIPAEVNVRSLLFPATREGVRQLAGLIFYNRELFTSDAAVDLLFAQRIVNNDGYAIEKLTESIARNEDVLDGKLGAIKQPTLIVWGREDKLTPLLFAERFKREIPQAQLVIIERCGHVPQIEKPVEFNAALMKFLGEPAAN